MTAILVEYARFVEVRQRRARIVEELMRTAPEAPVAASGPVPVDARPVDLAVWRTHREQCRGFGLT